MPTALALIAAILVGIFGVRVTARTSFGRAPWNPGPFWVHVFLEVPIFILPAVILTPIDAVRDLWIFDNVPDETVALGIWLIFYAVIGYFVTLAVSDRVICAFAGRFNSDDYPSSNTSVQMGVLLICEIAVMVALFAMVKELPFLSLLSGGGVGEVRKEATIEFAGPTVVLAMARLYGFLGFLLAAARRSVGVARGLRYATLLASALCLTWSGEKSPLVIGLLGYWFMSRWQKGGRIGLRKTALVAGAACVLALILMAATTADPTGAAVGTAFAIRTFLGQISGLFQTLANFTPDPRYFVSWIPFAGSLVPDMPTFSRDLMVMTEGDTATSGTLNTLFLAEAYGAGGWPMLLVSPFLVGGSLALGLHFTRAFATRIGGREFGTCGTFLFLMNSWLTSGMASIVGFRGLILTCFILLTIAAPYRLVLTLARPPASRRDVVSA